VGASLLAMGSGLATSMLNGYHSRNRSIDCDNFPASADRSSVVEDAVTDKYL